MVKEKRKIADFKPGTKKATSTSKTRKIMASKKNFIQKIECDEHIGSKPHS